MSRSVMDLEIQHPTFDRWTKEISRNDECLKAIEQLRDAMNSEGLDVFDQRERDLVKQKEIQILERQSAAMNTLTERKRLYEKEVLVLQEHLLKRNSVMQRISETTKVFDFFPELADTFAKDEASLRTNIIDLCHKLQE